jgi:hypothetical protein
MVLPWSISVLEVLECSLYRCLFKVPGTWYSCRWLVGLITRSNIGRAGGIGTVKSVLETSGW